MQAKRKNHFHSQNNHGVINVDPHHSPIVYLLK